MKLSYSDLKLVHFGLKMALTGLKLLLSSLIVAFINELNPSLHKLKILVTQPTQAPIFIP